MSMKSNSNTYILNRFLQSSYGLNSQLHILQFVSIIAIICEQIIIVYLPWFYKILTLTLLIFMPLDSISIESQLPVTEIRVDAKIEPIILNQYRSFVDDRKAKVGSASDIQKLKKYGFKNSRYISKSFASLILGESSADESNLRKSIVKKKMKASNKKYKKAP